VLEVDDLAGGAVAGVSLTVAPGEIVGIAGLTGSGRDDFLGRVFGSFPRAGGRVRIGGKDLPDSRPDLAIARGVAYLAPDRKTSGGVMNLTARENLTMPNLRPFWKGLLLRKKLELARTAEWFERLGVRPAGTFDEPLSIFSGGNQQKILFGKWLSQGPSVFLLDEPTQGVDVGAKADLHRELRAAASDGAAVVISSSDLEELADLCNRVVVLVEGRIAAELTGNAVTEAAITREFMPAAAVPA
jgi:ribose transport system ATP-binding protein